MKFDMDHLVVWKTVNDKDWENNKITIEKAYAALYFSQLAYECIPEFELKDVKRIKMVPCKEYQLSILQNKMTDIKANLRNIDFNDSFIFEEANFIVLGVKLKSVIFIAIRGTTNIYDWWTNLKTLRKSDEKGSLFHIGFYRQAKIAHTRIIKEIENLLRGKEKTNIRVVFTGHSLGGAIATITQNFPSEISNSSLCITFGMPRYGDSSAIKTGHSYHFLSDLDIVPNLPPKFLGYSNSLNEYILSKESNSLYKKTIRKNMKVPDWIEMMLKVKKEHLIEMYKIRIINEMKKKGFKNEEPYILKIK